MPMTTRQARRERTDPFERVGEDPDHPVAVMRRAWRRGARPVARPGLFELTAGIGTNERNGRDDVAKIEQALSLTGDYDLARTEGPTGHFSDAKARAIMTFQRRNNLRVDGQIRPGGPTVRALRKQLVSTSPTRDVSPAGEKPAAGEAPGGRRKADAEVQVAALPLIVAGGVAAWPEIAGIAAFAGKALLGGLGIAGLLSLRGDTPEGGGEPAGDDAEARHGRALQDRGVEVFLRPFHESRGDEFTQRGNDIVVRECDKILRADFPELEGRVEHIGGATEEGEGVKKKKEIDIPNKHNPDNPRLGSTRPDISFMLDGDEKKKRFHVNTASMLVDGTTPTKRERRQLEKLSRLGERVVKAMPKLRSGMDEGEYAELARDVCRDILKDAKDEFDGEGTGDE